VHVRAYEDFDHDACRALWVELTERHRFIYDDPTIGGADPGAAFDGYLANPGRTCTWVATVDEAVIGFTGLFVEGDQAEIEPIVVTERLRSQGTGRALLQTAIAEAKRRGVEFLSIKPVARNIEAIKLFAATGFDKLGHLDLTMYLGDRPRTWRDGIDVHGRRFGY
jgi:GNAT superfamily N-acetyltransferase